MKYNKISKEARLWATSILVMSVVYWMTYVTYLSWHESRWVALALLSLLSSVLVEVWFVRPWSLSCLQRARISGICNTARDKFAYDLSVHCIVRALCSGHMSGLCAVAASFRIDCSSSSILQWFYNDAELSSDTSRLNWYLHSVSVETLIHCIYVNL